MQGKVWSVTCTQREVSELEANFQVISMTRTTDGMVLRIVSEYQPMQTATTVYPTLEDLYLHHFGEVAISDEGTVINAF